MATTVTTHSSSVRVARVSTLSTLAASVDSSSMSPKTCMSLPSSPVSMTGLSLPPSPVSVTGMSGLLNSRNLDEKLVVTTLATLNSGSASTLIKQDLNWIIQSRRKAEGKSELKVEFKKPVRDELTSEELVKRAHRREQNRLAARRSREKGQKRKDMLVEEIRKLQSQNSELVNILGDLTEQRNSIVGTKRQHMKQCSDYHSTQSAAVGFPSVTASEAQVHGVPDLYICTGDSSSSHSRSQSPSGIVKQEAFSSCPAYQLVMGFCGNLVEVRHNAAPVVVYDGSTSLVNPSFFSLPSSQVGYSIPLSSPEFEPLPLPSAVPRFASHRSCTRSSDSARTGSTSRVTDQEETTHYKHKLMKHRKQFSEATEEICKLQSQNSELVNILGDLTEQGNSIVGTKRQHMKQCSDYHSTQSAAVGFPSVTASEAQVHGVSDLYICTGDSSSSHSRSQSPSGIVKQEAFSSCPASPLVMGFSGNLDEVRHNAAPVVVYDGFTLVNPSFFSLPSPQAGYSIPLSSPEFEPLPLPSAVPRFASHRSCTRSSDSARTGSTSRVTDQEETTHYKHKLMKHRKQFSEATEVAGRGMKVSLERSFSFPSTVRESRSGLEPSFSGSYMAELTQSDSSITSLSQTLSSTTALDSGSC